MASGVEERKFRIQLQSEEELETLVFKLRNTLRNLNVDVDNSWEFCQQKLDELRENEKTIDVQLRIARDAVNVRCSLHISPTVTAIIAHVSAYA